MSLFANVMESSLTLTVLVDSGYMTIILRVFYLLEKMKKMNKVHLAEWLEEEGMDDDDIAILKCRLILLPTYQIYAWRIIYEVSIKLIIAHSTVRNFWLCRIVTFIFWEVQVTGQSKTYNNPCLTERSIFGTLYGCSSFQCV